MQYTIATVERETGLTRETLRIWERRYGFPRPSRDAQGDRSYSPQDVEHLLLIKRLLDMGYRPGRVVPLALDELRRLGQGGAAPAARAVTLESLPQGEFLQPLLEGRPEALRQALDHALLRLGLADFLQRVVAPLVLGLGEAWMRGDVPVHAEHTCSEIIEQVLRRALDKMPRQVGGPRVLLTTAAGELHNLGLLMAEGQFTLEGAQCLTLGVNLPNAEIAAAARLHRAQIVGLSFSAAYPRRQIGPVLRTLRGQLDASTDLWAGGMALQHLRLPPGVTRCVRLSDLPGLLRDWRRRQDGMAALGGPLLVV